MNSNPYITIQLKSHFLRLYQMALTDDNFDILELQMLYHFAEERGIPKEELDKLFLNPVNQESKIPEDLNVRIEYLYDLTRIMWADGKITDDETNTLKKYCKKFEFLDENIEDITNYLIDCVQKGISKEEIMNQLNYEIMKSLQQLFSLKKVEKPQANSFEDNEEDREQIRITYYQSGFAASVKATGKPIVLKTCFQNLYTSFLDQCSKQKLEQERLKQPYKEEQEKSKTELKKWETAIGIYEKKEQEINETISEIKHEIVEVKHNPDKFGIENGKGIKAQFYIGLLLLLPITLYLLVFYISASYSAFFKIFSDDSLTAAIFDADALTNSFKASWLEGVLVITIPFVFMGLGYIIHMIQKNKGIKNTFRMVSLFTTTFLFDGLLAYIIEKKIYEFNKTPDSSPYNLEIALEQAEFWMIIFAGFVVYVIWGLVFDFVMKEYENLDKIRAFIRAKKEQLMNIELLKSENIDKINDFKQKVTLTNGTISELQSKIDGFIFPIKEYLLYHNQYKEGWYQAINTEIALANREKTELLENCDQLSNEHLIDIKLIEPDFQNLIYVKN